MNEINYGSQGVLTLTSVVEILLAERSRKKFFLTFS